MLKRYSTSEMTEIWREERKFDLWQQIELATLDARAKFGQLSRPQAAERIREQAKFSLKRIEEIEAETQHDLLAFVQVVQENLEPEIRGEFHAGLTSYDTEEIPTNLRIRDSLIILSDTLEMLISVILKQADNHRKTLMIGKTHGQHAEPITFGLRLLGWVDIFQRDQHRLSQAQETISVGKISGAVGTYSELGPEIEAEVCRAFNLKPARHTTQIIHRDRIAQVLTTLAILAGDIEHVAVNFRKMADTDIMEVREPFGAKQKGSSAMPHKKNTIVTERLCGLARNIRANCLVALENIATWEERDISQSAPERIILPDSFHLIHYMLKQLTRVLDKMEVFPANMLRNLDKTHGCIFSSHVKNLLIGWGMDPEDAYRLVQERSFEADKTGRSLLTILLNERLLQAYLEEDEPGNGGKINQLRGCFDPWQGLKNIDVIYARFGL